MNDLLATPEGDLMRATTDMTQFEFKFVGGETIYMSRSQLDTISAFVIYLRNMAQKVRDDIA